MRRSTKGFVGPICSLLTDIVLCRGPYGNYIVDDAFWAAISMLRKGAETVAIALCIVGLLFHLPVELRDTTNASRRYAWQTFPDQRLHLLDLPEDILVLICQYVVHVDYGRLNVVIYTDFPRLHRHIIYAFGIMCTERRERPKLAGGPIRIGDERAQMAEFCDRCAVAEC